MICNIHCLLLYQKRNLEKSDANTPCIKTEKLMEVMELMDHYYVSFKFGWISQRSMMQMTS